MTMVTLSNLRTMIDAISEQKKLPVSVVESALREALLKGYERYRRTQRMGDVFEEEHFSNFDVQLDLDEEGFRILATKTIVEEVDEPDHQIGLAEVQEVLPEAQVGMDVVLDVTPDKDEFGRMAAIQTKQVLAQKLRDHERRLIQEEFQDLEDPVLTARVLRFERQSVIVAVTSGYGRREVEAELPKKEQLPNDNYRANATFRVFLKEVSETPRRGPQLIVSRANAGLVAYLFENEVPEMQDEVVRIIAIAREANPPSRHVGPRTKIAVDTLERDVDPVGACIGARGSRIQVVVNELRGEKIDVIRWSPDPGLYIANALSPARIDEVRLIDPEARQAHVLVGEDQLSLAIGKEGQNVRLAARLTGWKIDIKDVAKYDPNEYMTVVRAKPPADEFEDEYEDEDEYEALAAEEEAALAADAEAPNGSPAPSDSAATDDLAAEAEAEAESEMEAEAEAEMEAEMEAEAEAEMDAEEKMSDGAEDENPEDESDDEEADDDKDEEM